MRKFLIFSMVMMLVLSITSCSNTNNSGLGTVAGGVAGGLLGSTVGGGAGKLVAVGVGAVAGALLGNEIGKKMDKNDNAKVSNTLEHNVTNQPTYWVNEQTGGKYMVVPESDWFTYQGNPNCRRYASTGYVSGTKRHIHGIACKDEGGTWVVVKRN